MSQDKEKFKVPRSVQQVIPIQRIWSDGVFKIGKNKYSKSFKFTDINYAVLSMEEQKSMLNKYIEVLGSLDTTTTTKITVNNRRISKDEFERQCYLNKRDDDLNHFREEYNDAMFGKMQNRNCIVQDKYVTVSVYKRNIEEARNAFYRIGNELRTRFGRLGSRMEEMDAMERLRCLHDFYRIGEEAGFQMDLKELMQKGHSFKDSICPDSMEFENDHFKIGNRYGRVLFLRDYGNYLKDTIISDMMSLNKNMMVSVDIINVPTAEAVREIENVSLGIETNIANYQRKQNENQNYSAIIPYDMQLQREEIFELRKDITEKDRKMTFAVLTLVHIADTKEELDIDTESIENAATNAHGNLGVLRLRSQQMDGLNTVLPIGNRKIDAVRTLSSESLGALMPFSVQEINDKGGIYFGENTRSGNLIICNKSLLLNPNALILGVPGSGKSFNAKENITFIALSTDDDIIICDPEREYASLIEALGGTVIRIAAGSDDHINAMDMVEGYGDERNSVIEKSQFILSLLEQLDKINITARGRSIIDRCTREVYADYQKGGKTPTLCVLREKLMEQEEQEAKDIALAMEIFTEGSLNVFSYETNVDLNNRMVVFDIMDLKEKLRTMGLLVVTDAMLNRVTENWKKGKRTHLFIDEFHVVFQDSYSAEFFDSAWRRFRKRNAFPTAITQNVDFLLHNDMSRNMISNSEFIVMLNQATGDREALGRLLNISEDQLDAVKDKPAGTGLIRYGSAIVPFTNQFPKNTELYKLMTTKPGEDEAFRNR